MPCPTMTIDYLEKQAIEYEKRISLVVELLENRIRQLEKQNTELQSNNTKLVIEKRLIVESILSPAAQKKLQDDLNYLHDFVRNHEKYITQVNAFKTVQDIRKVLIVLK